MILRFIFLLMVLLCSTSISWANEISCKQLSMMPVLDDGRMKPMDTYARQLLLRLSSKDTYNRKPALDWVCRLLFSPDAIRDDKIFLINHPDIARALNIEVSTHRRYSFNEIIKSKEKLDELAQAAQSIPEKKRSIIEAEILRLDDNLHLVVRLSREFLFALEHHDFSIRSSGMIKRLGLSEQGGQYAFIDIALVADRLEPIIAQLERSSPEAWNAHQKAYVKLATNLHHWSTVYREQDLHILPKSRAGESWQSAWDAIAQDFKDQTTREAIKNLRMMAVAFKSKNQKNLDEAAGRYINLVGTHFTKEELKKWRYIDLEVLYNSCMPFLIAKICYILVLILMAAAFIKEHKLFYNAAWILTCFAFVAHVAGVVARCFILQRPPVSTLYETFIFVAAMAVLLGLIIERFQKKWLGLLIASFSGVVLLFIASRYAAEGDTFKMLVAVLNSNFWLGTHVTTITMGYGATCVAGIIGHVWLVQAALGKKQAVLKETHDILCGILGLSLILTFVGTNLGGIWADQSWGRFWGWDPKENGALMIVLWVAMLLHMKVAKMAGPFGLAIGSVLGMIVVMWAWFGVNLLSIGLHSYGFTSGIALSLGLYVAAELIFLGFMAWRIRLKK